ncbi:MAG: LamG domain-containing protein [Gammaproteobacteria bacterium]|nr:LamG domain-containing protein [Gammaproteobacteria bacterium]
MPSVLKLSNTIWGYSGGLSFDQTLCSYYFDNSNNYINYDGAVDSTIEGTAKVFSLRFVLRRTATGISWFFSNWKAGTNDRSLLCSFRGSDELKMFFSSDGINTSGTWEGTTQITDEDWHDVIMIYNNGVVTVYLDGAVESGTSTTIPTTLYATAVSTELGSGNAGANVFEGYKNQFQVTNDVITAQEAIDLWNGGSPRLGSDIVGSLVLNSIFDADTWNGSVWDVINTEGTNGTSSGMIAVDHDCNENPY